VGIGSIPNARDRESFIARLPSSTDEGFSLAVWTAARACIVARRPRKDAAPVCLHPNFIVFGDTYAVCDLRQHYPRWPRCLRADQRSPGRPRCVCRQTGDSCVGSAPATCAAPRWFVPHGTRYPFLCSRCHEFGARCCGIRACRTCGHSSILVESPVTVDPASLAYLTAPSQIVIRFEFRVADGLPPQKIGGCSMCARHSHAARLIIPGAPATHGIRQREPHGCSRCDGASFARTIDVSRQTFSRQVHDADID
jgi:hypothetical protein